jgi:hypothetical protein
MSKWTSRFQLGQSTSIPGVVLNPENVHQIQDEGEIILFRVISPDLFASLSFLYWSRESAQCKNHD